MRASVCASRALLVLVAGLAFAGRLAAQGGNFLPPAPAPVPPPGWEAPPAPPVPAPPTQPFAGPPVTLVPPVPPPPPPRLPTSDPGPDGWGPYGPPSLPESLFATAEIQLLFPVLKNHLNSDVPLVGVNPLSAGSVPLSATVSPVLEIGYRLPDSLGLFAVNYRFLTTEGTGTVLADGRAFAARSRVDINSFDLDYGNTPFEFAPRWEVTYRLGARVADIYFDSQAAAGPFGALASANYFGAGPHARIDLNRQINPLPGLSLLIRADGAALVGQSHQRFVESGLDSTGAPLTGTFARTKTMAVEQVTAQVGLSYCPPTFKNLRLSTGYQYEHYWSLGQVGITSPAGISASHAEIYSNGWFFRAQFDF